MRGAVPSETLLQLVLDAYAHSNNSSERELPAFSTANYRRQSLRMFCKPQRETAEVSMQSQRNLICALLVLTVQLLTAYLHLMPPVSPLLGAKAFLPAEDLFGSIFPISLWGFREREQTRKIFFSATVFHSAAGSQAEGEGESRSGWGSAGINTRSESLIWVRKKAVPPFPHPSHDPEENAKRSLV